MGMGSANALAIELGLYLSQRTQPFDWATANCVHHAAGWVDHIEGSRLLAALPEPATARAAMRAVVHHGGWVAAVTHALGREPVAPALARLGDVVLLRLGGGAHALGLCAGRTTAYIDAAGACVHLPTLDGLVAWHLQVAA
ncbi:MAG: hypothetical protein LCH73_02965 [Proteobacteria bacterium]|nr:hypothetical protein [Pseudomonadota bacterium]